MTTPDPNNPQPWQQPPAAPPGQPPSFDKPAPPPAGPPPTYGSPPPPQYSPPSMPPQYGPPPGYPPQGGPYQPAPPAPPYSYAPGGIALPPGVELASVGRRIGAFFLGILLAIVTLGIGWIIWGLIVWGKGTTPALQVLGMKCWRPDHQEVPGWGIMALRQVVGRFIVESIIGIIGLISFIIFLTTEKRQALHDMVAATVVVYDPNKVLG